MSEELPYVAGCVSLKRVFQTEGEAQWALIDIKRNPLTQKIPERAYLCPLCHRWHLTSVKGIQRDNLRKLRPK